MQYVKMLVEAIKMFAFLVVELSVLFLVICYAIALIQQYSSNKKIELLLGGKRAVGYVLAALFGALTPFCSCSTIPVLRGFLKANVGFGQALTFLFVSPLLNPIIVALFIVSFGIKVTVIYSVIALLFSIIASISLDVLGFKKYLIKDHDTASNSCGCDCTELPLKQKNLKSNSKIAFHSAIKQFKDVFPYLLVGISVGSVIYGFLPTEFILKYAGGNNPFAVPIAAIIGVPLYIRMETVIPLAGMLALKGMNLGAIMALVIGSSGASITEVILLKSMFKVPLLIAFLLVIFSMAVLTGYLFQYIL